MSKSMTQLAQELLRALRQEKRDSMPVKMPTGNIGRNKRTMIINGSMTTEVESRTKAAIIAGCTTGNVCNALKGRRITKYGFEFKDC